MRTPLVGEVIEAVREATGFAATGIERSDMNKTGSRRFIVSISWVPGRRAASIHGTTKARSNRDAERLGPFLLVESLEDAVTDDECGRGVTAEFLELVQNVKIRFDVQDLDLDTAFIEPLLAPVAGPAVCLCVEFRKVFV
jgi:hypothetical protein